MCGADARPPPLKLILIVAIAASSTPGQRQRRRTGCPPHTGTSNASASGTMLIAAGKRSQQFAVGFDEDAGIRGRIQPAAGNRSSGCAPDRFRPPATAPPPVPAQCNSDTPAGSECETGPAVSRRDRAKLPAPARAALPRNSGYEPPAAAKPRLANLARYLVRRPDQPQPRTFPWDESATAAWLWHSKPPCPDRPLTRGFNL